MIPRGAWAVTLGSVAVLALGAGDDKPAPEFGKVVKRHYVGIIPCGVACRDRRACNRYRVPERCIRMAARRWGASAAVLLRRAYCESRMNPGAYNPSGASGLFQFMPGTWASTPYGNRSVWDAKWASLGAAWMEARGLGFHWVCR